MTASRAALALALSLAGTALAVPLAAPATADDSALYCVISEPVTYNGSELVGKKTVCVPGP